MPIHKGAQALFVQIINKFLKRLVGIVKEKWRDINVFVDAGLS